MEIILNDEEMQIFKVLENSKLYKRIAQWWEDTACLSGKTVLEQREKNIEQLKRCSKIIARNPKVKPEKIFGWWFCIDGYRKPRNLILC